MICVPQFLICYPVRHWTSGRMKVFISLLFVAAAVQAVRITDCDSKADVDLTNIQITGCSPSRRSCIFKRGTDAKMKLPFTPKYPIHKLTTVVHGIIGPLPIPFPMPNTDACEKSGLTCPLQPNVPVVYTQSLPVKNEYPRMPVMVRWELQDENSNDVVCITFPVTIQ